MDDARRFTFETDEFTILTDLQHFGGNTNLIDFTVDYLIALFFACNGDHSQNGRIILLKRSENTDEHIFGPRNPVNRVIAQKSVFVRPSEGYVERYDEVVIPHRLKIPMLIYLQSGHGISNETIYNDLHSFIRYRKTHEEIYGHYNAGFVRQNNGDYQRAIEFYTAAS